MDDIDINVPEEDRYDNTLAVMISKTSFSVVSNILNTLQRPYCYIQTFLVISFREEIRKHFVMNSSKLIETAKATLMTEKYKPFIDVLEQSIVTDELELGLGGREQSVTEEREGEEDE